MVLLNALSINVSWEHKIFVDGNNGADSESCFQGDIQSPCATVNMALKGLRYNSTVIYVSPGTYTLENGNETTINGKDKIAIIGSDKEVVIMCRPLSGLTFHYFNVVLIENVTLYGCGKPTQFHIQTPIPFFQLTVVYHFQAALNIYFCNNVKVNNVSIINSNGTGLLLVNIISNITVENSFITNSRASLPDNLNTFETYLIGGGIIFINENMESEQYVISKSIISNNDFKIHRSPYDDCPLDFGGGITLLQYYAPIELFLIDSCSVANNSRGLFVLQYDDSNILIRSSKFVLNWDNSIVNHFGSYSVLQFFDVIATQNFTIVSDYGLEDFATKIYSRKYDFTNNHLEISVGFSFINKSIDSFFLNFNEACILKEFMEGICSDNGVDYTGHCPTPYSVCYGAGCYCSIGRTGRLCGQCNNGYSVAINSHYLECVPSCDSPGKVAKGWAFLIGLEFVPITIMVAVIAILNVNLNQGSLNVYIFFCQITTIPFPSVGYSTWTESVNFNIDTGLTNAFLTPFSIWNLDFINFPSYKKYNDITETSVSICTSSNTTPLGALSFWYIIAFYPLVLILILYNCVVLYNKGCKCVVCIVRPVHCVLQRFWQLFDIQPSLIATLASVYKLCFAQLAAISLKILHPTSYVNGSGNSETVFYYDGTQPYFKGWHAVAGLFAILVLLFLNLSTLYLSLYPFKWFQLLLNKLMFKKDFLVSVTDVFTGPYEDGTQRNSLDYRYFVGLQFALHLLIMLIFCLTAQYVSYINAFYLVEFWYSFFVLISIFIFRPYKRKIHCFTEIFLYALLAVLIIYSDSNLWLVVVHYALLLFVVMPYCFFWMVRKYKGVCKHLSPYHHLQSVSNSLESASVSDTTDTNDTFDADRFLHPERYDSSHLKAAVADY